MSPQHSHHQSHPQSHRQSHKEPHPSQENIDGHEDSETSDDPYVLAWDKDDGARLAAAARDDAGWYAGIAAQLVKETDRLAVDVGCGGAGMALALAKNLSGDARVIGIDGSADVLADARLNLDAAGISPSKVALEVVDLHDGTEHLRKVVPERRADIVWASASVHHVGDQQGAIGNLAGLLAPGGRLALSEGGLRPRHLPWDLGVGTPGIELRLDAAQDKWFAQMRARLHGSVPMPYDWSEALRNAGLTEVTCRTTLLEKAIPLSDVNRELVISRFSSYVDRLTDAELLDDEDIETWDRLLDSEDEVWLGNRGDLYWLEARSVYLGTQAG